MLPAMAVFLFEAMPAFAVDESTTTVGADTIETYKDRLLAASFGDLGDDLVIDEKEPPPKEFITRYRTVDPIEVRSLAENEASDLYFAPYVLEATGKNLSFVKAETAPGGKVTVESGHNTLLTRDSIGEERTSTFIAYDGTLYFRSDAILRKSILTPDGNNAVIQKPGGMMAVGNANLEDLKDRLNPNVISGALFPAVAAYLGVKPKEPQTDISSVLYPPKVKRVDDSQPQEAETVQSNDQSAFAG